MAIEGYCSATSYFPGDFVEFHLRTTDAAHPDFQLEIFRKGQEEMLVRPAVLGQAQFLSVPDDAPENGCRWPRSETLTFQVPEEWPSGVYVARVTSERGEVTEILFVIKAAAPGANSRILFQLTFSTYEAYNPWGGRSLYGHFDDNGEFQWSNPRAYKVSFDRPGDVISFSNFYVYEHRFVRWLEKQGIKVEYCTSVDIHSNPALLDTYQLLLSVGHDEYWSGDMRDNVESFISKGGNVAFFSGNVCWWQVRFEDSNRTMVCYKSDDPDADHPPDPRFVIDHFGHPKVTIDPNVVSDPASTTVNWSDIPPGRPENIMTGVSSRYGAEGPFDPAQRPPVPYHVWRQWHWVFRSVALDSSGGFGGEQKIVGYETDATPVDSSRGVPVATGANGTPLRFIVLASADLTASVWTPIGEPPAGAIMGIYQRRGTVFTAGTTGWADGLSLVDGWTAVDQVTMNVVKRLERPNLGSGWVPLLLDDDT